MRKILRRLNNDEFVEDIKNYLTSPYEFYGMKIPEIKTMAKRLHKEHLLKDYYRVFNNLWNSGRQEKRSLAIYALELYEDDFDLSTWRFLKPKLKEIKNIEKADEISIQIIGKILIKFPKFENEIIKMSKSESFWIRRIAIVSTLPRIYLKDIKLTLNLADKYLNDREINVLNAVGWMLYEASKENSEKVKKFILKHKSMSDGVFMEATKGMKELRKVKKIKKF